MNKRQRKNKARQLKSKSQGQIIAKVSSPPHTERKVPTPHPRRGITFFEKTLSGTKLLWSLVVVVPITLAGGYATCRRHVSVEPYVPLSPVDPYQTQFTVRNENSVFEVHDIKSVCWPRKMASGNGFSVISPAPLQNVSHEIPSLGPGESSTLDCPPLIGGIGTYSGETINAELEIDVSYKQSFWVGTKTERYAFRAMTDTSKAVHWVHITPAEERPIFP
ncbi:MAG: hypothetical protein WCD47_16910 [Candidatus Sulfotelmatobacter sp.]